MHRLAIFVILSGSVACGQIATLPASWNGTWALSPQDSYTPYGVTVTGGSLDIASTPGRIKLSSYIVTSEQESLQQELDLGLDGSGRRVSFKRIDDTSFDIIVSVNNKKFGKHVEESHFVLSTDGEVLTETIREVNQETGAVINTSSILVFYKLLFIPPAGPVFLRPAESAFRVYIEDYGGESVLRG
jgi:hypothetical protein